MRSRALLAMTAALTLLPTAALAHPSFTPNEVELGAESDAVLVVPHGCAEQGGMPEQGESSLPTIELALELADGVRIVPSDVDGWDAELSDGVVTWTDDGGATTDPIEFPVRISTTADAAGEYLLSAFQACEGDQSFRWKQGSQYPPVKLLVTGGEGDHGSEDGDHGAADDGHGEGELGDPLPAGAQTLAGESADAFPAVIMVVVATLAVLLLVGGLVAGRRNP